MAGQIHDNYGKELLMEIAGNRFKSRGDFVKIYYPGGISATIDGVINDCAIEIESRVEKQVRGALLDLLEHPLQKKHLILIPAHMYNPEATAKHCEYILEKYKKQDDQITKVILLKGTGDNPKKEEDKEQLKRALIDLDVLRLR